MKEINTNKYLSKFLYISAAFRIHMKDRAGLYTEFWFQLFFTLVRVFVLLFLYRILFKNASTVSGIDYKQASWAISFYFIVGNLGQRRIYIWIDNAIKNGRVENMLAKPVGFLEYVTYTRIANALFNFTNTVVITLIFLLLFVGLPIIHSSLFVFSLKILVLMVGGYFVGLFMYTLVGLTAFYLEESRPVFMIVDKMVMILSGAYVPVSFFSPSFQKVSIYSPMGAINFAGLIFNPKYNDEFIFLLSLQIFFIVLLLTMIHFIYKDSIKKLTINGG